MLLTVTGVAVGADEDERTSSIRFGGARFEITHVLPDQPPPIPDLSREGDYPLPAGALFSVSLPILWREQVVPAGLYRLSFAVDADEVLSLALHGRGTVQALPIRRADFHEPEDGLAVGLTAFAGPQDRHRGILTVRWGAVLVEQTFQPLAEETSDVGEWRLTRYVIPEGVDTEKALPVGHLGRPRGAGQRRDLTLQRSPVGDLRLLVEHHEFLLMSAEKEALQLDRRALRRRVRRIEDDAAELKRLNDRLALVDKRLERLEERLRSLSTAKTHFAVTGEKVSSGNATPAVTARLSVDGETPVITVTERSGEYRFVLDL